MGIEYVEDPTVAASKNLVTSHRVAAVNQYQLPKHLRGFSVCEQARIPETDPRILLSITLYACIDVLYINKVR